MKVTVKIFTTLFLIFLTGSLMGQTAEIQSDKESDIRSKIYPKPEHPPGYYQGILLLSFSQGNLFSPTGSFISHEKDYDKTVKTGIESGYYGNLLKDRGMPDLYFEPEYNPLVTRQFDIEYGVSEHFGFGFSNFRYQIDAIRQDVIYGSDKFGQIYYEPVPVRKTLIKGNAFLFMSTFHPFPRKILDPYVVLRAGAVKFSGNAHSGMIYEAHRTSSIITNGLGKIAGGGLGLNFFIAPQLGVKIEGNYYRSFLSADQMSGRTLNTYNAQIGLFFNYSAIAAKIAREQEKLEEY